MNDVILIEDRNRLIGLDWIRGFSALWVFFHHLDITFQKPKYFDFSSLSLISSVGYHGVDLFFLLSGFVMAKTCKPRGVNSWLEARTFIGRRLFRIFPAYIAVFIPLFIVAVLFGVGAPASVPMDAQLFFENIFLLPRDDLTTYIPVVSWTLSHELMFYGIFLLSFISWRLFLAVLGIWALVSVGSYISAVNFPGWAMQTSWLNSYFFIGVLCAHFQKNISPVLAKILFIFALLITSVAMGFEAEHFSPATTNYFIMQLLYAISFTIIVYVASQIKSIPLTLFDYFGAYFGRISYGLYLVHYPIIVVVVLFAKKIDLTGGSALVFVSIFSLGLTVISSDILYRLIERPFIDYGRQLFVGK